MMTNDDEETQTARFNQEKYTSLMCRKWKRKCKIKKYWRRSARDYQPSIYAEKYCELTWYNTSVKLGLKQVESVSSMSNALD